VLYKQTKVIIDYRETSDVLMTFRGRGGITNNTFKRILGLKPNKQIRGFMGQWVGTDCDCLYDFPVNTTL